MTPVWFPGLPAIPEGIPPETQDVPPPGYRFEWVPDPDWTVDCVPDDRCHHWGCEGECVATLHRPTRTKFGRPYKRRERRCAEHLYGRRVEGSAVLVSRLVEIP